MFCSDKTRPADSRLSELKVADSSVLKVLNPFLAVAWCTTDSRSMLWSNDTNPADYRSFQFTSSGLPAVQLDTAYSAFVQAGPLDVSHALIFSSRSR